MSDAFLPLVFLGIRLFSFDVQIWVWVSLINSVIRARDWPCLPRRHDVPENERRGGDGCAKIAAENTVEVIQ